MRKVVINVCYGGFGLSTAAKERLAELGLTGPYNFDIKRDDPRLVQVVEELVEKAADQYAKLKIVEIPDDIEWEISEYDGNEVVEEKHRKWC